MPCLNPWFVYMLDMVSSPRSSQEAYRATGSVEKCNVNHWRSGMASM